LFAADDVVLKGLNTQRRRQEGGRRGEGKWGVGGRGCDGVERGGEKKEVRKQKERRERRDLGEGTEGRRK
jgi:hypothetical protein